MNAIVLDIETTGQNPEIDQIIEFAWIEFNKNENKQRYYARFKPSAPITFGAMATHLIIPQELENEPSVDTLTIPFVKYIIGHNIDFDWSFLEKYWPDNQPIPKRICTLALARTYFDAADSHTLAASILFLFKENLDYAKRLVAGSHSASRDALNATLLAAHFHESLSFEDASLEALYQLSEQARIPTKISFGKYQGTPIEELPKDYVKWLLKQDWLDFYLEKALTKHKQQELPL